MSKSLLSEKEQARKNSVWLLSLEQAFVRWERKQRAASVSLSLPQPQPLERKKKETRSKERNGTARGGKK